MAYKHRSKVYLGYEDELITEKHRSLVNFATNKIGGKPDSHKNDTTIVPPICKSCGLNELLALQLYAPLENSKYHRTLYIFACINPNCWNQNDSWTCLRIQSLEETSIHETTVIQAAVAPPTTSWLSSADDWGDDGNDNSNITERNGNVLKNEASKKLNLFTKFTDIEEEFSEDMANLSVDDPNANSPASVESPIGGGAVGRLDSPQASAEIEGEESEVVCIDTPIQPQCNLMELLHGVTPHPLHHSDVNSSINLIFTETFLDVEDEDLQHDIPQHVRDLFLEYQLCDPDTQMSDSSAKSNEIKAIDEKYEKSIPKHGDEIFHNFISRIQQNAGQLLRYCRDNTGPLLLSPLVSTISPCKYCGAERVFEVQVLPTLIPKLKLQPCRDKNFEIEFGTVLIYTCLVSCWSSNDNFKEEYVIVQAERL